MWDFERHKTNTMDPALRKTLVQICELKRKPDSDPLVFLDQNTSFLFDNQFYNQMIIGRGVLHIDQQLALDPLSRDMVHHFARNDSSFKEKFAKAMIKMGSIGVLDANRGDIRRNCRAFNIPL